MLTNRQSEWAEENEVIDEAQAGFRRGYSTIDNIFNLQSVIQKYISKKRGRIYVLFIDFLKAFDNCSHKKLWESLIRKGISPDSKLIRVFKSMYEQLKSCVKVENGVTEFFKCEKGTKQGCVSSAVIFSLYINDIITYLKSKCEHGIQISHDNCDLYGLLFADDVSSFADTVLNLQHQINHISDFCDATGMQLNMSKSKIMVFRTGGVLRNSERWLYRGEEMEVVQFYKYLGTYFTAKLSWTKTKQTLALQANKAINTILHYQKQYGHFDHNDAFKLFDAMVLPILTYSSEIWGYQSCDIVERPHIRFCKRIACLNSNVANFFALSECGRTPIAVTYMVRCVKYWLKILTMEENRYPKQCYKLLRRLDDVGRTTWATNIKRLLFQYGFGYVWLSEDVGDFNIFLSQFKQRLIDCSYQTLNGNIESSPKALSYKLYKSALNPEKYISVSLPYQYKNLLSNFRCSGHNLMIEKGRHLQIDRDLRHCQYCLGNNNYAIEDEKHFLLWCPLYEELRNALFLQEWLNYNTCDNLFVIIMSDTRYQGIIALAKYLNLAFDKRKQYLSI